MSHWLTIYSNDKVIPASPSVDVGDEDPTPYLGGNFSKAGSLTSWYIDDVVIVLSDGKMF